MTATMPTQAVVRAMRERLELHRIEVPPDVVLEELVARLDEVLEREGVTIIDTPEHEGEDLLVLPGGIVVGARSTYAYSTLWDPGVPLWTTEGFERDLERVLILSERLTQARLAWRAGRSWLEWAKGQRPKAYLYAVRATYREARR